MEWVAPTPAELEQMQKADEAVEQSRKESGRKLPRLMLHAHFSAESEDNLFTGFTENISEGGVFVSTLSPPGVGQIIRLNLCVDDAEDFQVNGEVRWLRYEDSGEITGCGVQFVGLTPSDVDRLRRLMLALPREPLFSDF